MNSRILLASILMACLPATAFLGASPVANAASAWQSFPKPGESVGKNAGNPAIKIKHRRRRGRPSKRLYLPIVPYSAYDYPYYYRRGFYPTHIGPGYVYYGYPYFRGMKYSSRCSHRYQRCVARKRGACICR